MIFRNFAVFEGIDGTGTTTQLNLLKSRYSNRSGPACAPVWFTGEPTSSEIGKLIRRSLSGEVPFTNDTMARLFASDRGEHLWGKGGIREYLDAGNAVFSDRYFFSSLAYQGATDDGGLTVDLNSRFPLPEYLFFFDIDPEISMKRVESRNGKLEIYEKRDFQRCVRERYLEIIKKYETAEKNMKVIRIDASAPVETIAEKIWSIARELPKIE
jgi:dTMP kinase